MTPKRLAIRDKCKLLACNYLDKVEVTHPSEVDGAAQCGVAGYADETLMSDAFSFSCMTTDWRCECELGSSGRM